MPRNGPAVLYGATGATAVALHGVPLLGDRADAVLFDAIGLSAVVAIAVGARWHRPALRAPWVLLALGQLLFVLGDTNAVLYDLVLHRDPPAPSLTDLFWLPAYPLLTCALLLLLRAQRAGSDRLGLVDSTILASGFAVLVWTYAVAPTAGDGSLGWTERGLAVTYPALDLLLLAVTFRLAVASGRTGLAQRLLVLSMLGVFAGDVVFAQQLLGDPLVVAAVAYPLWLGAYVAAGVAALHPSMAATAAPPPVDEQVAPPDGRRLAVLATCCLLAPAVLVVEWARGEHGQVPVVAAGAAAMFLLVVVRVSLMARDAQQLTGTIAAQRGQRRFQALVRGASDAILVVGLDGCVVPETPSVAAVLGHDPDTLRGLPLTTLFSAEDAAELLRPQGGDDGPREFQVRRGSGDWSAVEVARTDLTGDPEVAGIVLTVRDVSDRKALERQLQHQASHDALTGLPNRRVFLDRLTSALAQTPATPVTLLYVDLDNFKTVNDTLGHHWGDRLLVALGARLTGELREHDTLCRLGGDEFVALLPGVDVEQGCAVAERLRASLAEPVDLQGRTLRAGASIGVATAGPSGSARAGAAGGALEAEELLAAADTAMYVSKRSGRDRWTLFRDDMHAQLVRQGAVEAGLRTALEERQLEVAYQPLVRFGTGTVVGFEALARWTSPVLGVVSPAEFIPLAEDTGLVLPLGRYVLEQACAFVAACNAGRADPVRVAVNVSVRQLQERDFVSTVQAVLAANGVLAHLLTLEITESIRLFDGSAAVLARLKAIGVRLALDDFGTGYAALTHVTSLPIDEIKIDRSFVAALEDGGREAQLAASVVQLGQHLDLEIVAEGVETVGQAEQLEEMGCTYAQGYLYGRPLLAPAAHRLLQAEDELTARS